jgi:hypothetical protein
MMAGVAADMGRPSNGTRMKKIKDRIEVDQTRTMEAQRHEEKQNGDHVLFSSAFSVSLCLWGSIPFLIRLIRVSLLELPKTTGATNWASAVC